MREYRHREFTIAQRILNQLEKSYIRTLFFNPERMAKKMESHELLQESLYTLGFSSNVDFVKLPTDEIGLYFGILERIDEELKARGAGFYIVYWDYDMHAQFLDKYDNAVIGFLNEAQIPYATLSQIIGEDYKEDLERVKRGDLEHFKYRISRWDTHPNALANEKIAEFLAKRILEKEQK